MIEKGKELRDALQRRKDRKTLDAARRSLARPTLPRRYLQSDPLPLMVVSPCPCFTSPKFDRLPPPPHSHFHRFIQHLQSLQELLLCSNDASEDFEQDEEVEEGWWEVRKAEEERKVERGEEVEEVREVERLRGKVRSALARRWMLSRRGKEERGGRTHHRFRCGLQFPLRRSKPHNPA